jgi:pantothenate kinase
LATRKTRTKQKGRYDSMTAKGEQELAGMDKVAVDEVAQAGKAFLNARREHEEAKENMQAKAAEFVALARSKKRLQVRVAGVTLTVKRTEAKDVIKVQTPKEP